MQGDQSNEISSHNPGLLVLSSVATCDDNTRGEAGSGK